MSPLRTFLRAGALLPCLCMTLLCAQAQNLIVDTAFDPGAGPDALVTCVLPRADGKVLVLGNFNSVAGTTAGRIALLNADGTQDEAYLSGSGFNGPVQDAVMQPDGKVLVCGVFTSYNGTTLPGRLIRLLPDGSPDPEFQQLTSGLASINSLALMPDGRIVVGGNMGATNQVRVCRLMPNGTADPTFNTWLAFNDFVLDVAVTPDGKVLALGAFTMVHGVPRNRICLLNIDGSLDTAFDPGTGPDATPSESIVTSSGRIVIGGAFTQYNGASANRIVTLQADGSVDPAFTYGTGYNASVTHLSEADDGNIWVAGSMATYDGTPVAALHKLRPDGSVLPVFTTTNALNNPPVSLATMGASIYIGGFFTSINGQARARVARLYMCTTTTWYADNDEDGLGDPAVTMDACDQPTGYVDNDDDCDDWNDQVTTGTLWYLDQDGDGYGNVMAPTVIACFAPTGYVADNTDCNDADPAAHEVRIWYVDADLDGFGNAAIFVEACSRPEAHVADNTDCDDADVEANIERTWYLDADLDGQGNAAAPTVSCVRPPGHVPNSTDCDDDNWWLMGPTIWYRDDDHDGYGQNSETLVTCVQPNGYAAQGDDCDDSDPVVYLNAPCNDNNPLTHYDKIVAGCSCAGQGLRVMPIAFLDLHITDYVMDATLYDQGIIPLEEPYTALGYDLINGVGGRFTTPEMLDPIPASSELHAVDWIIVELRSAQDPTEVVASQACLLRRNGIIQRPDLFGPPEFLALQGSYYVAIRHRTHLGVMSAEPVSLAQFSWNTLDFTSEGTSTYGGPAAMLQRDDIWVLWQGDVGFNGDVQYTGSLNDRDKILTRIGGAVPTATLAGYYSEDVNMDGVVKYTGANNDRDVILQTIGGVVPTTIRQDHLPD